MPLDPGLQYFVERELGLRVVTIPSGQEKETGDPLIQVQTLSFPKGKDPKVVKVRPGSPLELRMFELLCSHHGEWGAPHASAFLHASFGNET